MIEDKNLRDKMSHNCRSIALQEYTIELQVQRHIELYEQIVAAEQKGEVEVARLAESRVVGTRADTRISMS